MVQVPLSPSTAADGSLCRSFEDWAVNFLPATFRVLDVALFTEKNNNSKNLNKLNNYCDNVAHTGLQQNAVI